MLPTEYCPEVITEYFDSTKRHTFPELPCTLHSEPIEEEPEPTEPEPTEPIIIEQPDNSPPDGDGHP